MVESSFLFWAIADHLAIFFFLSFKWSQFWTSERKVLCECSQGIGERLVMKSQINVYTHYWCDLQLFWSIDLIKVWVSLRCVHQYVNYVEILRCLSRKNIWRREDPSKYWWSRVTMTGKNMAVTVMILQWGQSVPVSVVNLLYSLPKSVLISFFVLLILSLNFFFPPLGLFF